MCASVHDSITSEDSRQERIHRIVTLVRARLDAAGVTEHRLVDDNDLYKVLYTAWWLTLTSGRNPDDPQELARTLRDLRLQDDQAGAA